ncbi:MAG: DegV family protein [Clostridia bacterium]|nr:DegV family protein [Clostridia bacterium]
MVRITTDSTADLGELFAARGIEVMPLIVTLDGNEYLDGVDIQPDDIFRTYNEKKLLPKTAARSKENFKEFFSKLVAAGDEVVHINLSSKISMTHENAKAAAAELKGVYVVDSLSLSSGTGLLVLYADDLRQKGLSADEIYKLVSARVPAVQASFVVDTMEYLHKGGRCSGVTRFVASVLKIKPTILVKDGAMTVGAKYMGAFDKSILKYVDNTLREFDTPDLTRIFVTHSYAAPETVAAVKARVAELKPFAEIIETVAGSTITSHCGKGTLGILYLNDGGQA